MKQYPLCGFAAVIITPPGQTDLAGYDTGSTRLATGVHDELEAMILILQTQSDLILIIQLDLLAIDDGVTQQIRAIAESLSIQSNNVFVCATHTHSGPTGTLQEDFVAGYHNVKVTGRYDPHLVGYMIRSIESGIHHAYNHREQAVIRYGFNQVTSVASNRNDASIECDQTLLAIEISLVGGSKILVYNYGCHPTVLSARNSLYTSDWLLGVKKQASKDGYDMTVFLNGSSADISTRYTRIESTFKEADRLGALVYQHIREALQYTEILLTQEHVTYSLQHNMKLKDTHESVDISIPILRLDDLYFLFIPAELCSTLSLPIRNKYGQKVIFCTLSNNCYAYIADQKAYENQWYEALASPFAMGEGEKLMEMIDGYIKEII